MSSDNANYTKYDASKRICFEELILCASLQCAEDVDEEIWNILNEEIRKGEIK